MKIKRTQLSNLLFVVVIVLLLIPQTRKPIQVVLNKAISQLGPSIEDEADRALFDFPSFKLVDLYGDRVNLSDFRGEVILLNFWATWCPPCIAELPHIQSLVNDYDNKIKIVLVSGENSEKVAAFLKKKGYNLNSFSPLENYPEMLNVSSIPRTFLISKEGEIVIDKTGPANWNSNKVRNLIDDMIE